MKALVFYDYLRVATSVVALISLYTLAGRARRQWPRYTTYMKDLWLALLAFQFLLVEGSLEKIFASTPGGPRDILALFATSICLRATARSDRVFLESWKKLEEQPPDS